VTAFLAWLRSLPLPAWLAGMLDAWQAGGEEDPRGAGVPLVPNPVVGAPGSVAPAVPEAPAGVGPRRINAAGLALVKASEGLRLTAYQDSGGVWTIGYGHTGRDVEPGMSIDEADAEMLLESDLAEAEHHVFTAGAAGHFGMTDGQFAALVDFTFNLGGRRSLGGGPSPLEQLLAHGLDQVPEQLLRWDHAAGVELAGLKLRREREAQLWRTGVWS
jgi:lysozyme